MKGIVLGLLSLLLGGCGLVIVEIEPDPSLSEQVDGVSVMFDIGYNVSKSSISPEEDAIRNLNLYAFCDGVLVASGYFEEMPDISLKLLYGHTYNLYSLANTGRVEVPSAEDAFQKECVLDVNVLADWGQEIPMAWKYEDFVVNSMVERVTVRLERLFAKVLFSVDKSALDGLHVNNVRLCQSPLSLWPFRYEETEIMQRRKTLQDSIRERRYAFMFRRIVRGVFWTEIVIRGQRSLRIFPERKACVRTLRLNVHLLKVGFILEPSCIASI